MADSFGIQISDGSSLISDYVIKHNDNSLELRDWQVRGKDFFLKYNKAIMEVSTGSGKTYFAIDVIKEVIKKEPNIKVLIVVPKNVILETGWYKELYDAGISLTKIGIYYGKIKEYAQITLTNMQNLNNIPLELFDFICLDEIHNYGTIKLLSIIKSKKFKYILGLSATLERMDGAHWDLMKIFDYRVFKYNAKDALRDGILNPFKFFNIGIILDGRTKEQYDFVSQRLNSLMVVNGGFKRIMLTSSKIKLRMLSLLNERKQMVNNYYKKFDVAKIICNKHKNDKVIIFNQFNEQTNKLYWHLLDLGLKARIIHSGIDATKREQTLIDFKNDKFNILLTSKVLDEGYNLPKLDVAIILAGDSSAKQTIQRMGRVLRKKDKHSTLYQVYCMDTIEQEYGDERAKLFKDLSCGYEDYMYEGKGDLLL